MTTYNFEYKGVTCIEVDWEHQDFLLAYKGKTCLFKQRRYISQSADTDHIRCVIEQFLEEVEYEEELKREVAREIFAEIDILGTYNPELYAELKKKYIGE